MGQMYAVSATVEGMDFPAVDGWPEGRDVCVTPVFYVKARSAKRARRKIPRIVDPLMLAPPASVRVRKIRAGGRKAKKR